MKKIFFVGFAAALAITSSALSVVHSNMVKMSQQQVQPPTWYGLSTINSSIKAINVAVDPKTSTTFYIVSTDGNVYQSVKGTVK